MDPVDALANAWCDLLGVDAAQPDQNFFLLGGDSLSALELVERVEKVSGFQLPIDILFTDGTYKSLVTAARTG